MPFFYLGTYDALFPFRKKSIFSTILNITYLKSRFPLFTGKKKRSTNKEENQQDKI